MSPAVRDVPRPKQRPSLPTNGAHHQTPLPRWPPKSPQNPTRIPCLMRRERERETKREREKEGKTTHLGHDTVHDVGGVALALALGVCHEYIQVGIARAERCARRGGGRFGVVARQNVAVAGDGRLAKVQLVGHGNGHRIEHVAEGLRDEGRRWLQRETGREGERTKRGKESVATLTQDGKGRVRTSLICGMLSRNKKSWRGLVGGF